MKTKELIPYTLNIGFKECVHFPLIILENDSGHVEACYWFVFAYDSYFLISVDTESKKLTYAPLENWIDEEDIHNLGKFIGECFHEYPNLNFSKIDSRQILEIMFGRLGTFTPVAIAQ